MCATGGVTYLVSENWVCDDDSSWFFYWKIHLSYHSCQSFILYLLRVTFDSSMAFIKKIHSQPLTNILIQRRQYYSLHSLRYFNISGLQSIPLKWEISQTYQRIRANRQRRLKLRTRKRHHTVESMLGYDLDEPREERPRERQSYDAEDEPVDVEGDSLGWPDAPINVDGRLF